MSCHLALVRLRVSDVLDAAYVTRLQIKVKTRELLILSQKNEPQVAGVQSRVTGLPSGYRPSTERGTRRMRRIRRFLPECTGSTRTTKVLPNQRYLRYGVSAMI